MKKHIAIFIVSINNICDIINKQRNIRYHKKRKNKDQ